MLRDLVRLSIRKFVVDYSADRASRSLQAGRLVGIAKGRDLGAEGIELGIELIFGGLQFFNLCFQHLQILLPANFFAFKKSDRSATHRELAFDVGSGFGQYG